MAVFRMRFGVGSPWAGCYLCQGGGDTDGLWSLGTRAGVTKVLGTPPAPLR